MMARVTTLLLLLFGMVAAAERPLQWVKELRGETSQVLRADYIKIANGLLIYDVSWGDESTSPVKSGDTCGVAWKMHLAAKGSKQARALVATGRFVSQTNGFVRTTISENGSGGMIPGLDAATIGMRPGGRRKVFVPSKMAFHTIGHPGMGIEAHADIVLFIEIDEKVKNEEL